MAAHLTLQQLSVTFVIDLKTSRPTQSLTFVTFTQTQTPTTSTVTFQLPNTSDKVTTWRKTIDYWPLLPCSQPSLTDPSRKRVLNGGTLSIATHILLESRENIKHECWACLCQELPFTGTRACLQRHKLMQLSSKLLFVKNTLRQDLICCNNK